jgi:putative membrane protein
MDATNPTPTNPKPLPSSNELAQDRTDLALERTVLAHERTVMAWIRTAASMISLGFGIYKFFDYFPPSKDVPKGLITPRRFAIFIILTGLFVLAGAAVQNWSELTRLRKMGRAPRSLAGAVAILMAVLGIFALIAVIFRQ